jgi:hypothetical protein
VEFILSYLLKNELFTYKYLTPVPSPEKGEG